jgi:hypothetical protein
VKKKDGRPFPVLVDGMGKTAMGKVELLGTVEKRQVWYRAHRSFLWFGR